MQDTHSTVAATTTLAQLSASEIPGTPKQPPLSETGPDGETTLGGLGKPRRPVRQDVSMLVVDLIHPIAFIPRLINLIRLFPLHSVDPHGSQTPHSTYKFHFESRLG